jgi:hypothetical protein
MATIKSFTDLKQSKKLTEILPKESADMGWYYSSNPLAARHQMWLGTKTENADIPCWSLAALLNIIRKVVGYTLQTTYNKDPKVFIVCELGDKPYTIESLEYDNEIDACYEMIIKLNEQKLL